MRDFRNAKAMAQTLRASLAAKSVKISASQSLELVSEMFGVGDWNTLAAIIRTDKSVSRERASSTAVLVAGDGNPVLPVSADLTATRERAIRFAAQRKHEYATLEHLLLSLIEDPDASDAMRVYSADFAALKGKLVDHLDNKLGILVIDNGSAKPTAAFQRVFQRAQRRALGLGQSNITGENILEAILFETESPAARLLVEQGITRQFFALIPHAREWDRMWKRRPKDST